jgi:hypothetical protein
VIEAAGRESDEEAPPTPIAERFGRYELVAELASGGMASVYLARLASEGDVARVVAVKRIHPHLAKAPGFAEMFLDEARIASRIDHPNVCQVLEYGRENGVSFLAMEFLSGESLQRIIGRLAAHPDASAARAMIVASLVAEAADGLHAAHELVDASGAPLEVVHRDVSPHNLFVTFDGTVKVVDFGIASAANQVHHTETGTVKGKFAYMAPEQLGGVRAERRVDVWALGVVLWESLTLKRLFRRESPSEVVRAVESQPILAPSTVREGLPTAIDAITLKALARDPKDRYATAKELARDLRAVVRASGIAIDRARIAEWMAELFPDGEAQRRAWLKRAAEVVTGSGERLAPATREASATPPTAVTRAERGATPTGVAEAGAPASARAKSTETAPPTKESEAKRSARWAWAAGLAVVLGLIGAGVVATTSGGSSTLEATVPMAAPSIAAPPPAAPPIAAPVPTPLAEPALETPAAEAVVPDPRPSGRTPRAPRHTTEAASPTPEPAPTAVGEGCITLGGGIVATIDGTRYDGPRARCITVATGDHDVSVAQAETGEALYERRMHVAGGARMALTASGVR